MRNTSVFLAGIALAAATSGGAGAAQTRPPIVVELFTSQGCSSCPPANANLITLSQRPDVLTLSFAVTYWDQLGWKDTFGKPEFTERQVTYEPGLDQFGPYTPQMVVNGATTVVGNKLDEIDTLLAGTRALAGPALDLGTAMLTVGAGTAPATGADVWRVTYDPKTVEVPVGRGENNGRTLPHTHVVHSLDNLGTWTGAVLELPVAASPAGLRTAILVQGKNGGKILSAVTN